ncbi:MAG TPA: helix-turn-helix transcriptional regulator [Candidatus Limnocylindrales bacterium]|nr:helix-turn-helix transcriptional regulator [Candidatus Limnocylindrales bacterium]
MDDRRVGRLLRSVRQHLGLRQIDVARKAGVGQGLVSRLEAGYLESVGLRKLRRVAAVLDVSIGVEAWWRGGQGDRLLDRAHASLVDHVVRELAKAGWEVVPEFTFNHYGDRGSVDILAWHAAERTLLIVEVKATLTDLQDLLASLSRKSRVVPALASTQLGWKPQHVAKLLVVAGTKGNRAVLARHAATFGAVFLARSRETRSWIARPHGALSGVWFVSTSSVVTGRTASRRRVRLANRPSAR